MQRIMLLLPLALMCGACVPGQESAARQAAEAFQKAVRQSDGLLAHQLLADEAKGNLESAARLPCSRALPPLDLPTGEVRAVQVWGGNAQVRLATGTLFLARFPTGWRVTGAGCQPRPSMPYDCDVEA